MGHRPSARLLTGVTTLAIAAVLLLAGESPAQVASAHPANPEMTNGPVRILGPSAGALVTRRAVTVRLRAPRGMRRLRAKLFARSSMKDVSGRFRAAGPRLHKATLRLGRELTPGEYHLYIAVRPRRGQRRVVATHFFVARPRDGMVRLRGVRNGVRAPVLARVRVRPGTRLRAKLNGRGVRRLFEPVGRGLFRARLAAHDGLRFGRNRLVVTAFTERGRYDRVIRLFRVSRDRPLVGAGGDRRVVLGTPARLDGSATKASRRGARLRMRWRIVDRPRGSRRARLRGRGRARPMLVADVPGRYTVRLQAREVRRARRGTQASALTPAADTMERSSPTSYPRACR